MSEPRDQPAPNYVISNCQHCDGHIEFDANEFTVENSLVPCPHCSLETKISIPVFQTVKMPMESPAPIADFNGSRREGFFCGEISIQGDEPNAHSEPISTQVIGGLQEDSQILSNRPAKVVEPLPIPKQGIRKADNWQKIMRWRKTLKEDNKTSQFRSKVVTLTKAQCEIPIVQELIGLLVEIEKDGFITDQGAHRLKEWLETESDTGILAFQFLIDKVKTILSCGKLTNETASGIEIALDLQVAIERVLPKDIREPILAKRRGVLDKLQNTLPATKEMIALIRQIGGKPRQGITRAEAYELKEKLWHTPSDKQLAYIRGLGGNPPPDITHEEASEMIGQLLSGVKATEKQAQFIHSLGGMPPAGLSQADASTLITQLLANQPPTPRQMMLLRFWNKTDLMQSTKEHVTIWLQQFYSQDSRRKAAWELFKAEGGDDGSQHDPLSVPIGAGETYMKRID